MVWGWDFIGKVNLSFLSCEVYYFWFSVIDLIVRIEGNFILGFWFKFIYKEICRNMVIMLNIIVIIEVSDCECY